MDGCQSIRPVTALSFLRLGQLYLLSGEGQDINIFDHDSRTLTAQIFESQAIHGFDVLDERGTQQEAQCRLILCWGGSSFCVVRVFGTLASQTNAGLRLEVIIPETNIDGWILDGKFAPHVSETCEHEISHQVLLATTSNDLLAFEFDQRPGDKSGSGSGSLRVAGAGPRYLLLSADIHINSNGTILIASGTVFGKVLLWSISTKFKAASSGPPTTIFDFDAHQGSVFGVHISDDIELENGSSTRFLASCSDDRAIKVWDIGARSRSFTSNPSDPCIASQIAHASRIWGVRFTRCKPGSLELLSRGEDATLQRWRLYLATEPVSGNQLSTIGSVLMHERTYAHHVGKNLLSVATIEDPSGQLLVATGGADGRIVSLLPEGVPSGQPRSMLSSKFNIRDIDAALSLPAQKDETDFSKSSRAILKSMQGRWKVSRVIKSANLSHPSGTLQGEATLEKRLALDQAFEDEYLYSENGNFVTDHGLVMRANRQYVYRFCVEKNEASIWFVKTDGSTAVDYLFHVLSFAHKTEEEPFKSARLSSSASANGYHLCVKDDYNAEYSFQIDGRDLKEWAVRYDVKGPDKDYVSSTTYSRMLSEVAVEDKMTHGANGNTGGLTKVGTLPVTRSDFLKGYVWLNNKEFVTTTEEGNVLLAHLDEDKTRGAVESSTKAQERVTWRIIGNVGDLKSGSTICHLPQHRLVLLLNGLGDSYIYQHESKSLNSLRRGKGKPAYAQMQDLSRRWSLTLGRLQELDSYNQVIALLTTILGQRTAKVTFYSPHDSSLRELGCWSLRWSETMLVTSSLFLEAPTLLLLGSRHGDLCIYYLHDGTALGDRAHERSRLIRNIHSDAITSIQTLHCESAVPIVDIVDGLDVSVLSALVMTTGRDGRYCIHQILTPDPMTPEGFARVETIHSSLLPFGPNIEGAYISSKDQNLILWGFRGTSYIVWNEAWQAEVMDVQCGGSHRHWAFSPGDSPSNSDIGGSFVWTKASVCNIFSQKSESHRLAQGGGHGREVKCLVRISTKWRGRWSLLATGAEDTNLRLFQYSSEAGLRCVGIIRDHVFGIQTVGVSGMKNIFFSAAGGEEFNAWRVSSIPILEVTNVCVARCPKVTEEADLRIMAFATGGERSHSSGFGELVYIAYSDSSVRLWEFARRGTKYEFTLKGSGVYTSSCLTQCHLCRFNIGDVLCTASTDGHLAIWPAPEIPPDHQMFSTSNTSDANGVTQTSPLPILSLRWTNRFAVHQSAVQCMVSCGMPNDTVFLISGGDDQAISLSFLAPEPYSSSKKPTALESSYEFQTISIPNAHASAVMGVAIIRYPETYRSLDQDICFASVGTDQRLKTWQVRFTHTNAEEQDAGLVRDLRFEKLNDVFTSIADASDMSFLPNEASIGNWPNKLCIVGIGMEMWNVFDGGRILERAGSNE